MGPTLSFMQQEGAAKRGVQAVHGLCRELAAHVLLFTVGVVGILSSLVPCSRWCLVVASVIISVIVIASVVVIIGLVLLLDFVN